MSLLSFLLIFSNVHLAFASLEKVAIIVRHGDRAPYAPWTPVDPINNRSDWPEGWGQLTMSGKQRMYSLGKFLGDRYLSLISHPDQVVVRSSSSVRCMLSVKCLLAGAFPPKKENQINPGLNWQPIPVKINDSMLYNHAACPAFDAERKRLRLFGEEAVFNLENADLYDFATEKTGRMERSSFAVYALYDKLMLAESRGLQLPSWATREVMKRLKAVAIADFYFNGQSLKQWKLRTGLLFKDIFDHFYNSSVKHKMFIYSTHDVEIYMMLQIMEAFDMTKVLVGFGGTLLIELHRMDTKDFASSKTNGNDHFIKIFYLKDKMVRNPQEIHFLGCKALHQCPLSRFLSKLHPLFVHNFVRECFSVA